MWRVHEFRVPDRVRAVAERPVFRFFHVESPMFSTHPSDGLAIGLLDTISKHAALDKQEWDLCSIDEWVRALRGVVSHIASLCSLIHCAVHFTSFCTPLTFAFPLDVFLCEAHVAHLPKSIVPPRTVTASPQRLTSVERRCCARKRHRWMLATITYLHIAC